MNDDNEDFEEGKEEGQEVEIKEETTSKVEKPQSAPLVSKDEGQEESTTDEDRESVRVRRREERQIQKQRRREASANKDRLISSLQRQNQEMAERLAQVESRQVGNDFDRLDRDLQQALRTANEAKEHIKNSATAADGEGVAEATDLYYKAMRRAEQIAAIKQNASRPRAPNKPQIERKVVHANKWMNENDWYDPEGDDEDSELVRSIDNRLAKEGFDPNTPEYWEELTDRIHEKLPHKFEGHSSGKNGKKNVGSPVSGSGRENGGKTSSSGKFYLSAERVKAMKDSGLWDDEKKRAAMIKSYQAYDRKKAEENDR